MSRHEEPVTWKQTYEPHWLVTPPTAHEVKNLASALNHVTNLPTGLVCPADASQLVHESSTSDPWAGHDRDDDDHDDDDGAKALRVAGPTPLPR